jgi:hypothetical protein
VRGAYSTLGHNKFGKQFYTDEIKAELAVAEKELAEEDKYESEKLTSEALRYRWASSRQERKD